MTETPKFTDNNNNNRLLVTKITNEEYARAQVTS